MEIPGSSIMKILFLSNLRLLKFIFGLSSLVSGSTYSAIRWGDSVETLEVKQVSQVAFPLPTPCSRLVGCTLGLSWGWAQRFLRSAHSSQCLRFRSYKAICSPITSHLGMKTTKAWDQQTSYRSERRAKVSFPFQHWSQNIIQGQAIWLRLGSIIACALCCVHNYTLMMYFHAAVPRKWSGSNGPGMSERVRHGNIWGKGE